MSGRTAIVTGGASGIGAAISRRLAADGAAVAIFDRNGDAAKDAVASIEATGGTAIGVRVDVADRSDVDAGLDEVRTRITVNTIPPGFIDTPMLRQTNQSGFFSLEQQIAKTPVRRIGQPEDVAAACAFLVSEEASYITGQVIGVNGGRNT